MLGSRPRPRLLVAGTLAASTLALVACALPTAGCTGAPREPRVLGEVPTAVTTAVPEWLPKRVRSGTAVPDDPREARLTELRRLTTGFDVEELAFAHGGDALVLVGRPPGQPAATAAFIDFASGKVALTSGSGLARGVSVNRAGDDALLVTSGPSGTHLEEVSVAKVIAHIFGIPTPDDGFATGELVLSRAALAPDAAHAYVVARAPQQTATSLFAVSRGTPPVGPIATNVAEVTPTVSPDRAYVSFVRQVAPGGEQSVVVSSIEGRSPRALADKAQFASLAFHPSDGTLVFGSDRDAASFELYATAVDGEPGALPERLTYRGAKAVAFSPDGRLVAFTSRRAGDTLDVYVARYRAGSSR